MVLVARGKDKLEKIKEQIEKDVAGISLILSRPHPSSHVFVDFMLIV